MLQEIAKSNLEPHVSKPLAPESTLAITTACGIQSVILRTDICLWFPPHTYSVTTDFVGITLPSA
jgi:hypothetical protein